MVTGKKATAWKNAMQMVGASTCVMGTGTGLFNSDQIKVH